MLVERREKKRKEKKRKEKKRKEESYYNDHVAGHPGRYGKS
jgi:hypothetical protein